MPFLKRNKIRKENLPNFQEAVPKKERKKERLMSFLEKKLRKKNPPNLPNFKKPLKPPVSKKKIKRKKLKKLFFLKKKIRSDN